MGLECCRGPYLRFVESLCSCSHVAAPSVSERLQSENCPQLPRDAGSFYHQSSAPLTDEPRPSESHRRLQAQRRGAVPHLRECGAADGAPVLCLREAREARRGAVAKEACPGAAPSPVSLEPRRRAPVALAALAVEGFCDAAPAQRLHHHVAERPRRGLARRLPNGDGGGRAGRGIDSWRRSVAAAASHATSYATRAARSRRAYSLT